MAANPNAQYDITNLIGPYLDRHLVFPLLEFLQVKGLYPENELLDGKLDLLSKTNMVDFAMEIWSKRHDNPTPPQGLCYFVLLGFTLHHYVHENISLL
mgnify:CR=1 FL=1|tara:strand:- start:2723 stop:3016 length:294 start_codon:yes stop_codon:yes gene_type:complete